MQFGNWNSGGGLYTSNSNWTEPLSDYTMCTIIPPKCQTWPIWNSQLDFGAKAMSHWNLSDYLILYLANQTQEKSLVRRLSRFWWALGWYIELRSHCYGTCSYFMSQFFVTCTLLLIQSIGIFVLCSTGVILPIIFKPACTVQSAKPKLFTHLLPEVLYHHLFDSTS